VRRRQLLVALAGTALLACAPIATEAPPASPASSLLAMPLHDPHGFVCGTCVGVALDTRSMLASAMSLKAIRAAIDTKWSATGPATPTPYPDE